ncbi:protein kinase domain-containing protein [Bremerella sp. P1]|uniref:protein kinase domain-containing protein n=1 Tax=Bremerella sp. P1 TaxID=3026424 RepID=UPI0023688FC3|nr:TIGR03067 domain-containing protein [Bremerella sp. P1]WDI42250.1 TIGR03067 domain-containing protein [Bremerella sp. P1]
MPEKANHPSPAQLHAFGLGRLSADEATAIEEHINKCEPCCETIVDLSSDDTFLGLLQSVDREPTDQTVDQSSGTTTSSSESVPTPLAEHPRYEIVGLIGRGGMGDVYKAQHRKMKRTVALKVINRKLFRQGQAVSRFHREVEAAAQLSHPNIVTAHDADQAGDFHFMVMEYVDGVDLAQVVRDNGVLPIGKAADYIRQAALGLQHANERGMVHRDIKPHNLMVTTDGTVKILDFGLASLAPETLSDNDEVEARGDLTVAGSIMGTPDFISPEQAEDARNADIRSDIYSLGATLYYLLAGRSPIAGSNVTEKLKNLAESETQSLQEIRHDIPAELCAVVEKMLAKNPDERFQSPAEVAEALLPFADGEKSSNATVSSSNARKTKTFRNFLIAAGLIGLVVSLAIAMMRESVGDKLAKMAPGVTSVNYPPEGKEYLLLYTVEGDALDGTPAAICDIGDCRIALLGQDISTTRDFSVGVNVAVSDALPASSTRERDTSGNVFFTSNSGDGKASCKFHGFKFDLTDSMISIGKNWSHRWKDPSSPGLLILVDTKTNHFTTQAMKPRSERELLPARWKAPQQLDSDSESGLKLSPELQAGLRESGQSPTEFNSKLNATISHAAGIPNDQWEKTAQGMGTDAIEGTPLSEVLLMSAPAGTSDPGAAPTPPAFRMLTSRMPKPQDLHKAISPSQAHGYVSIIQPEYIQKITLDLDPETKLFKGTVWFEAPELYAGKVDFALKYDASRMEVVEFTLPELGLKLTRAPNGLWVRNEIETPAEPSNAEAMNDLASSVPRVTDRDRIQGDWGATSQFVDGTPVARNFERDVIYYMISGFTVNVLGGPEIDHAKFRLDDTQSPKTIDIQHEDGSIERGIYEVEGESLVICTAKPGNKDRPTEMESQKGSGTTLTTFELLDLPVQLDSQRIEKTWQLISSVADGAETEQDEPLYFIFDEDRLVIDAGTEKEQRNYRLVYSDDGPKKINLIFFNGDVTRCIYEIEGDTMRLCLQDFETNERPTSFEATPESKTTLLTFKEVPPTFSDHQLIQGTWQLTEKMNDEGPIETSEWKANPTTFVFQGNKLIRNDGTEKLDTDFYLDPTWDQITLIDEEWRLTLGSYEFDGDTLRISLSDDEYLPTSSLEDNPSSHIKVFIFKRVKQAATDQDGLPGIKPRSFADPAETARAHFRAIFEGDEKTLKTTYAANVQLMPGHEFLKDQYGLTEPGSRAKGAQLPRETLIKAFTQHPVTPTKKEAIQEMLPLIKFEQLAVAEGDFVIVADPADAIDESDKKLHFQIQNRDVLIKVAPPRGDFALLQMRKQDGTWRVVSEYLD